MQTQADIIPREQGLPEEPNVTESRKIAVIWNDNDWVMVSIIRHTKSGWVHRTVSISKEEAMDIGNALTNRENL